MGKLWLCERTLPLPCRLTTCRGLHGVTVLLGVAICWPAAVAVCWLDESGRLLLLLLRRVRCALAALFRAKGPVPIQRKRAGLPLRSGGEAGGPGGSIWGSAYQKPSGLASVFKRHGTGLTKHLHVLSAPLGRCNKLQSAGDLSHLSSTMLPSSTINGWQPTNQHSLG